MTLSDQIKLTDVLVRNEPDTTIREYLDMVKEIDNIKPVEMSKPKQYTPDQAQFMLTHHKSFTAVEMAVRLNIEVATVYNFAYRNKLSFKSVNQSQVAFEREDKRRNERKKPLIRPAAQYSNHSPYGIAS